MKKGTAALYLRAAQIEGNISLQGFRGDVWADGLTLKGTLKVEFAEFGALVIAEARVEENMELIYVNLEVAIYAKRLVLGGDLSLTEVLVRYHPLGAGFDFEGAQVGGKFEAKNIEGKGIEAQGMQIGKSLIWEEIKAETVDLKGTRVGEELAIASLTGDKWESDEMIVVGKASIKGVRILGGFLGNEVK